MALLVALLAGLLVVVESQASETADRSQGGFLSKHSPLRSDAPKITLADYNKFITPNLNHVTHGNGLNVMSYRPEDFDLPKVVDKQEEKAVQKLLANNTNGPVTLSAIGVGLFTLVMMFGIRKRRGLQPDIDLASSFMFGSEVSSDVARGLGENGMEMKSQASSKNCEEVFEMRPQTGSFSIATDMTTDISGTLGFDPLDFHEDISYSHGSEACDKYFREDELEHGRTAMHAALGFQLPKLASSQRAVALVGIGVTAMMPVAAMAATAAATPSLDWGKIATKAIGGGASGAAAGVVQVATLMWLRTAMNYQYAKGGNNTLATVKDLYKEGGVPRLYRGVQYALVQNPISRFGDAAANAAVPALVIALFAQNGPLPFHWDVPRPATQACASAAAAGWRILIAPVDALKTALQVDGSAAGLGDRVKTLGPGVLWRGSLAAATATFVGNYPWFLTYNSLDASLPPELYDGPANVLVRRALLGVCASCASDVCSNAIRVVKTKVQTSPEETVNPFLVTQEILAEDGLEGLFFRGLETRLTINCLQGAVFSVAWKYFEQALAS